MARKVDEPWTKCRNPTDLDWTRALAHDGRDPRSWPQTKPCRGHHVLEQSYTANQHGAWISCARCALRLHYIPRHTARMTSVSTPSSASVQEALKRMSLLRDNDFTAKAARDMIAEVEGRKPRKKKPTPQTTIVYNCDDQLGNSSAQRHFDTTITSVLSDNSSAAPIFCGHPPEGKDESQTGKCSDDGRGPVKTLSGRLARKLQRSASQVNAGLSKQIPCLERSLANATAPTERVNLQPFLLTSAAPSCCMSSKMSETAKLNVDSETGSLGSMGSGMDSISCLRLSSIGEMAYTGSGEPPGAALTCSELRKIVNSEVNTSVSEMGNCDIMESGLESISGSGMSSVDATTSSGKGDPPSSALSGNTGSKLRETANLKVNTFA